MNIGNYKVIKTLGEGGMGTARLAVCPKGRLVVLKSTVRDTKDLEDRLIDEARIGMRLKHPNLVNTVELTWDNMRPVLVIDYIDGLSFAQLSRGTPLPTFAVARFGRQLASALHALHCAKDEHGVPLNIVHRDITPANIMVTRSGSAQIIDLGIARFARSMAEKTKTGCVRGTLRYLAPELFKGKQCSPSSDLWSLGIVLLSAALGQNPIKGTDAEIIGKIMGSRVIHFDNYPNLDPKLRAILEKLLVSDPNKRIQDAAEAATLFADLEQSSASNQSIVEKWLEPHFKDTKDENELRRVYAVHDQSKNITPVEDLSTGGFCTRDFSVDICPTSSLAEVERFRSLPTTKDSADRVRSGTSSSYLSASAEQTTQPDPKEASATQPETNQHEPSIDFFKIYMNSLRNLEKEASANIVQKGPPSPQSYASLFTSANQ